MDTLSDIRARAKTYLGKSIEVRGVVKGIVSRGDGFAALLELPQKETLLVDAPATLRNGALGRVGARVRVLAKVNSVSGQTHRLRRSSPRHALKRRSPVARLRSRCPLAAQRRPAEVLVGPDADFAPTRPSSTLATLVPRGKLSSRSLPSPRVLNPSRPAQRNRISGSPRKAARHLRIWRDATIHACLPRWLITSRPRF
jgi:hypothetical protein